MLLSSSSPSGGTEEWPRYRDSALAKLRSLQNVRIGQEARSPGFRSRRRIRDFLPCDRYCLPSQTIDRGKLEAEACVRVQRDHELERELSIARILCRNLEAEVRDPCIICPGGTTDDLTVAKNSLLMATMLCTRSRFWWWSVMTADEQRRAGGGTRASGHRPTPRLNLSSSGSSMLSPTSRRCARHSV